MLVQIIEVLDEHISVIDFAMFIIIWMVQLIIYPSFARFEDEHFVDWHKTYCQRIGLFVLPLMFAQIIHSSASCFFEGLAYDWIKLAANLGSWVITFSISAPLHGKLQEGKDYELIAKLVKTNWLRTFFWSLVFIISIYQYYQ